MMFPPVWASVLLLSSLSSDFRISGAQREKTNVRNRTWREQHEEWRNNNKTTNQRRDTKRGSGTQKQKKSLQSDLERCPTEDRRNCCRLKVRYKTYKTQIMLKTAPLSSGKKVLKCFLQASLSTPNQWKGNLTLWTNPADVKFTPMEQTDLSKKIYDKTSHCNQRNTTWLCEKRHNSWLH